MVTYICENRREPKLGRARKQIINYADPNGKKNVAMVKRDVNALQELF
jgi:hypothetical protein